MLPCSTQVKVELCIESVETSVQLLMTNTLNSVDLDVCS
jgi:hypothetical protein